MKLPFNTASFCSPAFYELHFHVSAKSATSVAHKILITHIVSAESFSPANQRDLDYIWNVWYNTQWSAITIKRFVKDVDQLLARQFSKTISIPNEEDFLKLSKIWNAWKTKVNNIDEKTLNRLVNER